MREWVGMVTEVNFSSRLTRVWLKSRRKQQKQLRESVPVSVEAVAHSLRKRTESPVLLWFLSATKCLKSRSSGANGLQSGVQEFLDRHYSVIVRDTQVSSQRKDTKDHEDVYGVGGTPTPYFWSTFLMSRKHSEDFFWNAARGKSIVSSAMHAVLFPMTNSEASVIRRLIPNENAIKSILWDIIDN